MCFDVSQKDSVQMTGRRTIHIDDNALVRLCVQFVHQQIRQQEVAEEIHAQLFLNAVRRFAPSRQSHHGRVVDNHVDFLTA